MPIQSNATYLSTIDDFLAHWGPVDLALAPAPGLTVKGNIDQQEMIDLRQTLVDNQTEVQAQLNERQIARNTMNMLRAVMLEVLGKFNGIVDGFYGGTIFEGTRPNVPGAEVRLQDFADPMMEAQTLWVRLNAAAAPSGLTLPIAVPVTVPAILGLTPGTSVTQAVFTALMAALHVAHGNIAVVDRDLTTARNQRNATQRIIYEALKNYRMTVGTRLPSDSPLLEDLPKLTAESSRTPEPVNASAVFVAPDQAKIVFDASLDPDLDRYEVHAVTGDEWDSDDAVTIGTIAKDADPLEFVTNFGLTQPGSAATYKIVVVLTSGNRRGSVAMTVFRPVV